MVYSFLCDFDTKTEKFLLHFFITEHDKDQIVQLCIDGDNLNFLDQISENVYFTPNAYLEATEVAQTSMLDGFADGCFRDFVHEKYHGLALGEQESIKARIEDVRNSILFLNSRNFAMFNPQTKVCNVDYITAIMHEFISLPHVHKLDKTHVVNLHDMFVRSRCNSFFVKQNERVEVQVMPHLTFGSKLLFLYKIPNRQLDKFTLNVTNHDLDAFNRCVIHIAKTQQTEYYYPLLSWTILTSIEHMFMKYGQCKTLQVTFALSTLVCTHIMSHMILRTGISRQLGVYYHLFLYLGCAATCASFAIMMLIRYSDLLYMRRMTDVFNFLNGFRLTDYIDADEFDAFKAFMQRKMQLASVKSRDFIIRPDMTQFVDITALFTHFDANFLINSYRSPFKEVYKRLACMFLYEHINFSSVLEKLRSAICAIENNVIQSQFMFILSELKPQLEQIRKQKRCLYFCAQDNNFSIEAFITNPSLLLNEHTEFLVSDFVRGSVSTSMRLSTMFLHRIRHAAFLVQSLLFRSYYADKDLNYTATFS